MAKPIVLKEIVRRNIYEIYAKNGYRVGAEIGVYQGRNAVNILNTVPELTLYGIDSWAVFPKKRRFNKKHQKLNYNLMKQRTRNFRKNKRFIVIKKNSMDAVKDFEDGSLDFVYIDANHEFDYVMRDIIEWSKKVRVGGIISGHDYSKRIIGVKIAVDAYVQAHEIKTWHITNIEKGKHDKWNSFFWVKEC